MKKVIVRKIGDREGNRVMVGDGHINKSDRKAEWQGWSVMEVDIVYLWAGQFRKG